MAKMKPIRQLSFGFNDAWNYSTPENRTLFEKLFLCNEYVDAICGPDKYFLVGEKGTGKTAYAVYLSNNEHGEAISRTVYVQDTDYLKFLKLKNEKHLILSDYTEIWKVILLLLVAEKIGRDESDVAEAATGFRALKTAIDQFYYYAFRPEINNAFQFIESPQDSARLLYDRIKGSPETGHGIIFSESRFQTNLLFLQKQFEDVLGGLALKKHHILFVDGIDIRPSELEYKEYMECVKGLTNAVWSLNSTFFPSIAGTKNRIKVLLLIRPDIFDSVGLHNLNNKLRDNAVILEWRTTYQDYRSSNLFKMADQMLRGQQDKPDSVRVGESWDYYFPYKVISSKQRVSDSSFVPFLRYSFYRPRDIVSLLDRMKIRFEAKDRSDKEVFRESDFLDSTTQKDYSNYLLGGSSPFFPVKEVPALTV